MAHGVVACVSL